VVKNEIYDCRTFAKSPGKKRDLGIESPTGVRENITLLPEETMKRLFFLYWLASISCLSNAQAQVPDKSYFQHIYATTQQALELEHYGKAQRLSTFFKRAMPDSADYDAIYYDFKLVITTSPSNLEGIVTGVFRSNVDNLTRVNLNFDSRENLPPGKALAFPAT
jgi:hypothetical protein